MVHVSRQPPRILLVLDTLKVGGTERQALLLARGLARRGWAVRILCLDAETPLADGRRDHPFTVESLDRRNPLMKCMSFVSSLKEFRPDVVQSFSARPHAYCVAAKALGLRFSWVVAVREALPVFHFKSLKHLLTDFLVFRGQWGVGSFLSNSRRALAEKGVDGAVIPNLLDPAFHARTEAARDSARRALQFDSGAFVIGAVCNTTPYKGLEVLFQAASRLAADGIDVHVVLAGEERGPYGRELLKEAKKTLGGRFRFLGLRGDLASVLPAFDVLCSSATTESSSNSIAEAMACGLPCVVTDVGDSADLVGDTGWVVAPSSPERLALALQEAQRAGVGSLLARGERARKRVELLRDPERAANDHDRFYHGLIGADSPQRARFP